MPADGLPEPAPQETRAVLAAVAARLAAADAEELDDAIRDVLGRMGRHAGVDRAFLIAISHSRQTFTSTHEWCAEGIHSQLEYFVELPLSVFGWTSAQLLQGRHVATGCMDDYPPEAAPERQICEEEKIQSIIFVPTLARGQVTGTIGFDAIRSPRAWTDDLVTLLQVTGGMIAALLERRHVEERLTAIGRLEREKLGRDLHDSLGQNLAAISLLATSLQKGLAATDAIRAGTATRITELATAVVQTARDMTKGLCPFDVRGEGLKAALTRMAEETSRLMNVSCRFFDGETPPVEDPEACTQLFWIAREATNNAIRHGRARNVVITMSARAGKQRLAIQDDGEGLPADWESKDGIGLKVMKYRAAVMGGQVSIQRGADCGAIVTCVFAVPSGPSPTIAKN